MWIEGQNTETEMSMWSVLVYYIQFSFMVLGLRLRGWDQIVDALALNVKSTRQWILSIVLGSASGFLLYSALTGAFGFNIMPFGGGYMSINMLAGTGSILANMNVVFIGFFEEIGRFIYFCSLSNWIFSRFKNISKGDAIIVGMILASIFFSATHIPAYFASQQGLFAFSFAAIIGFLWLMATQLWKLEIFKSVKWLYFTEHVLWFSIFAHIAYDFAVFSSFSLAISRIAVMIIPWAIITYSLKRNIKGIVNNE